MSIREVPTEMTPEMVTGFFQGYYKGRPLKLELVNADAVRRRDVRNGYAHLLAATPEHKRPNLDNIPGNELVRNLRKFGILGKYMAREMKPHVVRWLRRPWSPHDFTNMFVEAARLSPYLVGHVNVVVYSLFIGLIFLL